MCAFRCPLLGLREMSIRDLEIDSPIMKQLDEQYIIFKELLPFNSVPELEGYFEADDFCISKTIDVFYGKINACPASERLKNDFLLRNRSLQLRCAMQFSDVSARYGKCSIGRLLTLPRKAFYDVIRSVRYSCCESYFFSTSSYFGFP